ncbi:SEC-C metal-binding domain-containing protein [Eubacterium multiforme]|uniref:Preprotein translocase subunit SecA n=1 Tax=Eubacterium multiforme TaxID=83339 RepID=A0ABT9UY82_9FIRM|nr:SEC-C metal-binding domain-containing protein [Eubacterium multiforme]MDQ0151272.1 preprotein translocase subunit SecA [Eubacterium multiforme]
MSLYKNWTDMVVEYVKTKGEKAFWEEYGNIETSIYKDLLSNHKEVKKTTINELAKDYNTTAEFIMGFVDGINDSLKDNYDLEAIDENTELVFDIDLEKLYFNMLDAKADYLYTLPQWEGIFSEEKRKEIQKKYRESKIVRNDDKIGRNDPCPCGSGKKYKKCCGRK